MATEQEEKTDLPEGRRLVSWLRASGFSAALLILITAATNPDAVYFNFVPVCLLAGSLGILFYVFPRSYFFSISLSNYVALYSCIFAVLVQANFRSAHEWVMSIAFAAPLVAFIVGAVVHRENIRHLIEDRHLMERDSDRTASYRWLVPVGLVGVLTFFIPEGEWQERDHSIALLVGMGLIGLIVFWVSEAVCAFLVETGLLFEDFFKQIGSVVIPAFAFITFYTMNVVVFGCLYRILDTVSVEPQFMIQGERRLIDFSEALYFALVTLSTVGYGDIAPDSVLVRFLASIQIIFGVLLLIFGVSEIQRYRDKKSAQLRAKQLESGES
ncbi:potassium channel family protein [Rhodovibrionaceae bacterium A322]